MGKPNICWSKTIALRFTLKCDLFIRTLFFSRRQKMENTTSFEQLNWCFAQMGHIVPQNHWFPYQRGQTWDILNWFALIYRYL